MSFFATKWNVGVGYGGEGMYGFSKKYWSIGWHRVSNGTWKFHLGRWYK